MRKTPITPCRYANPAPPVKGHARNPPLDAIAAFQEVRADSHEAHEVSADTGHQQEVTDKHNVIDYVN